MRHTAVAGSFLCSLGDTCAPFGGFGSSGLVQIFEQRKEPKLISTTIAFVSAPTGNKFRDPLIHHFARGTRKEFGDTTTLEF